MSRVQSIERAFRVLTALSDGPSGVTTIAERAHLPKSTVVRLLRALQTEAAVEQVAGDGRYRLGPRVSTLAAGLTPTRSIAALARPHLADLAAATGEAAGLSVPDGRDVLTVDQVDTPNPISIRDWTGTRAPMHTVPAGHVFLASLPPAAVERYLAGPLEATSAHTITDPDILRARLREVGRTGYAWVHDEFLDGMSSVAAGIGDVTGDVVAAIHVHGPSYRFPPPGTEASLGALVAAAAARVSTALRHGA
ncbi:MAG TPA: IclR family transcriptional regulator [Candidatus Limnocylindrales bacterium]|nr:IclR family transcriptional regulator [Candidatus Limnocylindrales bacterium]